VAKEGEKEEEMSAKNRRRKRKSEYFTLNKKNIGKKVNKFVAEGGINFYCNTTTNFAK